MDSLPEIQAQKITNIIFNINERERRGEKGEEEEGEEEREEEGEEEREEEREEKEREWRDGLCLKFLNFRTEVSDFVVKKVVKGLKLIE